jgi:DNA gyrase inhibitor GyrI
VLLLLLQALEELPAATRSEVALGQVPGGYYAAAVFNGVATPSKSNEVEAQLRQQLQQEGLQAAGSEWLLARYNDPSVKPAFRRNEVLIPLADFDLWAERKA